MSFNAHHIGVTKKHNKGFVGGSATVHPAQTPNKQGAASASAHVSSKKKDKAAAAASTNVISAVFAARSNSSASVAASAATGAAADAYADVEARIRASRASFDDDTDPLSGPRAMADGDDDGDAQEHDPRDGVTLTPHYAKSSRRGSEAKSDSGASAGDGSSNSNPLNGGRGGVTAASLVAHLAGEAQGVLTRRVGFTPARDPRSLKPARPEDGSFNLVTLNTNKYSDPLDNLALAKVYGYDPRWSASAAAAAAGSVAAVASSSFGALLRAAGAGDSLLSNGTAGAAGGGVKVDAMAVLAELSALAYGLNTQSRRDNGGEASKGAKARPLDPARKRALARVLTAIQTLASNNNTNGTNANAAAANAANIRTVAGLSQALANAVLAASNSSASSAKKGKLSNKTAPADPESITAGEAEADATQQQQPSVLAGAVPVDALELLVLRVARSAVRLIYGDDYPYPSPLHATCVPDRLPALLLHWPEQEAIYGAAVKAEIEAELSGERKKLKELQQQQQQQQLEQEQDGIDGNSGAKKKSKKQSAAAAVLASKSAEIAADSAKAVKTAVAAAASGRAGGVTAAALKPTPGLANLGNTCFLNSALQVMMHIPLLAQWLCLTASEETLKLAGVDPASLSASSASAKGGSVSAPAAVTGGALSAGASRIESLAQLFGRRLARRGQSLHLPLAASASTSASAGSHKAMDSDDGDDENEDATLAHSVQVLESLLSAAENAPSRKGPSVPPVTNTLPLVNSSAATESPQALFSVLLTLWRSGQHIVVSNALTRLRAIAATRVWERSVAEARVQVPPPHALPRPPNHPAHPVAPVATPGGGRPTLTVTAHNAGMAFFPHHKDPSVAAALNRGDGLVSRLAPTHPLHPLWAPRPSSMVDDATANAAGTAAARSAASPVAVLALRRVAVADDCAALARSLLAASSGGSAPLTTVPGSKAPTAAANGAAPAPTPVPLAPADGASAAEAAVAAYLGQYAPAAPAAALTARPFILANSSHSSSVTASTRGEMTVSDADAAAALAAVAFGDPLSAAVAELGGDRHAHRCVRCQGHSAAAAAALAASGKTPFCAVCTLQRLAVSFHMRGRVTVAGANKDSNALANVPPREIAPKWVVRHLKAIIPSMEAFGTQILIFIKDKNQSNLHLKTALYGAF